MLLSVIIPVFKKEDSIVQTLESIHAALSKTRWPFEIIVVIDGFLDNSFPKASGVNLPNTQVVGYEKNRGKGYAVKYGMARTKGELVAFIDDSMEINPNGISILIEHMLWYNADAVVGSKRHPASKIGNYTFMRKVYSGCYYTFVRLLFGLRVRDTQTGLKVYKREVLEKVLPRLMIKEFAFDIEMLVVAKRLGFGRIFEAPVELSMDLSGTTFDGFLFLQPSIRRMINDTLAVFYRLKIRRHYDDGNKLNWEYDRDLRLKQKHQTFEVKKTPRFSIVIPVRTVNDVLGECIYNIKKLDYPDFEVIIILDEGEDPGVMDDRFGFVAVGNKGPGEKRNIGVSMATGDIVTFLDDDAFPTKDWLTKAAEVFMDENIYAVGGPATTPPEAGFLERMSGRILETYLASGMTVYRHTPASRRLIDDYPTVNLFVRKEAFESVGGFETEFWPGEDTKLCLDLIEKYGRKFVYDPAPLVHHHRRDVLIPHLKQVSRYGQHRGQFAKIFPQNSRIFSYFIPSLFVLGLLLGPLTYFISSFLFGLYLDILILYLGLLIFEGIRVLFKEKNIFSPIVVCFGVIATHLVYGTNFIVGLIRRPKLELRKVDEVTGSYLGG